MSWLSISTIEDLEVLPSLSLANARDLLKVLGSLKDKLPELSSKNTIEILDLLIVDQEKYSPIVAPALSQITELSEEQITQHWKDLKDRYNGEHSLKLRSLSRKLNELSTDQPNIIEWKLFESDISKSESVNTKASLSFGSLINASIELEANASLPTLPSGVTFAQADKAVLRIGMDGNLEVNGKSAFSAGVFTGSAEKEITGKVEADFYFIEEADSRFGSAASENLKSLVDCKEGSTGLCSPFQLNDLQKLLNQDDLHCFTLSADSTLKFDLNLGMAKTYNFKDEVKVKLGVDVTSTAKETGKFNYTLSSHSVGGESVIAVHIKRNHSSENSHAQSFGIEVDATHLAKKLYPLIEDHLGEAKSALDEFKDLLPGSDYIENKLTSVIDNTFDDNEFKKAIKGLVGLDSSITPEQALRNRIIGVIETTADGWSDSINTAVPGIVDEVIDGIKHYTPNFPDVKQKIEEAVKKALEEKQKELNEKVKAAIPDSSSYKKIAKKINAAGEKIAATTTDIQKGVDNATNAVKKLLNRLQKKIDTLSELYKVATEKTVSLKITSQRKARKQEGLDLRFDLYPERDLNKAQSALDAIVLGEMNEAIKIANTLQSESSEPAVIALEGDYTLFQELSESNTLDLVLWGFNFGNKSIMEVDLKWTVNIDGSITAVTQAEYTHGDTERKNKRAVSFFMNTEMIFATQKSTVNTGITISREDEELNYAEVEKFLSGLVDRNLLDNNTVLKAGNLLKNRADKHLTKGRLDIGITFTRDQLASMLNGVEEMRTITRCTNNTLACVTPSVKCPDGTGKKGCHWVLDTVSNINAEVMYKHHSDKHLIERLEDVLKVLEIEGGLAAGIRKMTPETVTRYVNNYEIYADDFTYYSDFDELYEDLAVLEYRRYGAMALYEILAHMKALSNTGEGMQLDTNGTTLPGWKPDELLAQQYRVMKILPVWWQWSNHWKEWFFLTDQMRSTNIALIESWVNLAKGPDGEGDSPMVWVSLSLPNKDNILVPELLT